MIDPEDFRARFAAKLRILRSRRGLRLVDLEAFGLTVRAVQLAENAQAFPTIRSLLRFADAYGVRPSELLRVEGVDPTAMRVSRGGRRTKGLPATRAHRPARRRRGARQ